MQSDWYGFDWILIYILNSRRSDEYVQYAYDQIMNQLEKEHAEIRLSAFQISDELFNRSHEFRNLLLAHFQDYMELTIGNVTFFLVRFNVIFLFLRLFPSNEPRFPTRFCLWKFKVISRCRLIFTKTGWNTAIV